jgi:hypothetical protein
MDFLKVCGLRRSIRIFRPWQQVEREKIQLKEPEAGGQRPRLPFETLYFEGVYGKPFNRDPKVVEDLTREGLLQTQMPKPDRFEELKHLARMLGFPL